MDVLVTGVTGYVGAAIADALLAAGHRVSGLARSEESAEKPEERGITAVRGDVTDAASVGEAARGVEAVAHAATTHGEGAEQADRTAVGAILDASGDTGRMFAYTSVAPRWGARPRGWGWRTRRRR